MNQVGCCAGAVTYRTVLDVDRGLSWEEALAMRDDYVAEVRMAGGTLDPLVGFHLFTTSKQIGKTGGSTPRTALQATLIEPADQLSLWVRDVLLKLVCLELACPSPILTAMLTEVCPVTRQVCPRRMPLLPCMSGGSMGLGAISDAGGDVRVVPDWLQGSLMRAARNDPLCCAQGTRTSSW